MGWREDEGACYAQVLDEAERRANDEDARSEEDGDWFERGRRAARRTGSVMSAEEARALGALTAAPRAAAVPRGRRRLVVDFGGRYGNATLTVECDEASAPGWFPWLRERVDHMGGTLLPVAGDRQ